MGNRMIKKIYHYICVIRWILWGIGICITWCWKFIFHNANNLFFNVIIGYDLLVSLCSFIPIQFFCLIIILVRKYEKKEKYKAIFKFILSIAIWYMFIACFIGWTGI